MRALGLLLLLLAFDGAPGRAAFERELMAAEEALEAGDHEGARPHAARALEHDPRSLRAWDLWASWAGAAGDRDERAYALHRAAALARAQGRGYEAQAARREVLLAEDPRAAELFGLRDEFLERLAKLAEGYEDEDRPHSAIRVHRQVLALDAENEVSLRAIERIASTPDPSLAGDAKPADLLAGISEEWIAAYDAEHAEWKEHAVLERENYTTRTNAGYAVLLRAAEAMEQMNAFYRVFFEYGTEEDGRNPSPIELRIFHTREDYLRYGSSPAEWSGGQFTGSAVETYVGDAGFEGTVGTLFHEAAHQFVSLATNASGWLNEGLASYFEGSRLLSNGTVLTNRPANHRLFPLVARMAHGWMESATDGAIPGDPTVYPVKAPTFRIVLENEYEWGPPWYGPTWGVVYFLYNFQEPADGRFVYRDAFREYVDKSGGRVGKGAISTFEEVVLGNPAPPTKGVGSTLELPETVDELNPLWGDWLTRLRDEQSGRLEVERAYAEWARHAVTRGDRPDAQELLEQGVAERPEDAGLRVELAELLASREDTDRAVRLLREAAELLAGADEVDLARLTQLEGRIAELDPRHRTLERLRQELRERATAIVRGYLEEGLVLVAMDVAWRLGTEFDLPELQPLFEEGVRRAGRSLARWRLAYDEESLDGWAAEGQTIFHPEGVDLAARFGRYAPDDFSYRFLTLDEVTSGDFSFEAEVQVEHGRVAFAGLVFGRKSTDDFHALILYPPEPGENGYVDLATFYGGGAFDTWRHNPVTARTQPDGTARSEAWYRLRIDVTGRNVDVWIDGAFVATHEFASLGVLRGTFGLIVGPGHARFRNLRYLARPARDPAARIERAVRMDARAESGESVDGSWLGLVPPFPQAERWLSGQRASWRDEGPVLQLLVLWSIEQNGRVRIDPWLRALAEELGEVLEIVCVAAGYDAERIDAYLANRPFPGAVALDRLGDEKGIGVTHARYGVDRFFLPRLVLLDVDGRVAWEGDPGFSAGTEWRGEPSLLRAPLDDLIEKRGVREMRAWLSRWSEEALPAMAAGDVASAALLLLEAERLEVMGYPELDDAHRRLAAIRTATGDAENLAQALVAEGREPALSVLDSWGEAVDAPIEDREVRRILRGKGVKAWEKALGYLRPAQRAAAAGQDPEIAERILERMAALEGTFTDELVERIREVSDDPEALGEVVRSAEDMPRRWLVQRFGW